MVNWYALFVESGKEDLVQKHLHLKFDQCALQTLVPRRKITEKKQGIVKHVFKKMFPGYVFIQTEMDSVIYNDIKSTPRIFTLVNIGKYYEGKETHFSSIALEEMDVILKLVGPGGCIDYSTVHVDKDSKVSVISGPLKGFEGIIKKIDKHKNRAKIVINLLNQNLTVDVGIEVLREVL
ncbi:antiterminator LoaP [Paenibacillus durus]|uniref:Transcription termination/antitermination protein NusG n=1 Tax=Paenibacillus durus TaxID=44251 RepID=A0A089HQE7_PAEDU|nr:antiterminator LoaP [Paenibacillus durus]AIQ12920.1 transcription antiterminator [Paenibacillus durus]